MVEILISKADNGYVMELSEFDSKLGEVLEERLVFSGVVALLRGAAARLEPSIPVEITEMPELGESWVTSSSAVEREIFGDG